MADQEQHSHARARQGPSAPARQEGKKCGAGFHVLLPSPGINMGIQTHGTGDRAWGSVAGTLSSPARGITGDHVGPLPPKGSSGGPGAS